MKHFRRKTNRRFLRVEKRLNKIETTLQLKHQCILCGFDQGKPDTLYGEKVPKDIFPKLGIVEGRMEHMDAINKIQAALTELRREIQRSEAPKTGDNVLHQVPSWYCTCPTEIPCPVHDRNYQELKGKIGGTFNPNKTAGNKPLEPCHNYPYRINKAIINSGGWPEDEILDEVAKLREKLGKCTCDHSLSDCPICKRQKSVARKAREKFEASITPDLPLHVKVAKALGMKPFQLNMYDNKTNKELGEEWFMSPIGKPPYFNTVPIPDYPNDLVAAMGALEEYDQRQSANLRVEIRKHEDGWNVWIGMYWGEQKEEALAIDNSLPQAICEAIVVHSEGE